MKELTRYIAWIVCKSLLGLCGQDRSGHRALKGFLSV